MKCDKKHLLLYAVTDRSWTNNMTLAEQVALAIKGGVTCVQLREKHLDQKSFLSEAFEIKKVCSQYGVPFIVNDNVYVALSCGAEGVHLGQHDMSIEATRKMIGNDMILGVSVQTPEQAVSAEKNGADYLGVGALFETGTKADADFVRRETFKKICRTVSIPVIGIGGIGKQNILELENTDSAGVALISAIFSAVDIENECRELRRLCEQMVGLEKRKGCMEC